MASFTKRLSITESDSLYSLSDSGGAEGYAVSKEDTHIWGSALEKKNGKYVFSKQYATFTFEIKRASGTDFQNPRNISIDIEYFQGEHDKDGNEIHRKEILCSDLDLNSTRGDGILIYGSKSVDIGDLDKTALLRVQLSTKRLYNKGQIKKIWIHVDYSDMNFGVKDHELNEDFYFDNIKICKGHYWQKKGLYWRMQDNGEYDLKTFFPLSKVQSGSINVYSATTDGSTSTFYTEENGQFIIKTNALSFLSTVNSSISYRIPSHYFFTGTLKGGAPVEMEYVNLEPTKIITNKDGSLGPKEYSDTYSPGSDNTRSTVINTSDYDFFKNCKKIDKIEMCFGGNFNNKITIHDSSILNIDINDNLPMSFSTGTDGSTRINYVSSVLRDKVNLYSFLKGNISRHDQGIIEFIDSFALTGNSKEIPVSIAVQNNQLVIDDRKDYTCAINNNNQLNLENRAFQNIPYNLRCKIKNKLKVKDGSEYFRTFDISNLSLTAANEIVALKGPIVSISYTNEEGNSYEVPGLIIIKGEVLKFSDDSFEFYNIATGAKDYTSRSHEIGLSTKAEYFQKKVQNLGNTVSVSYDELKENYITNYGGEPDEQITLLLGYDFNNSNVYSYTFTYFLGRVAQNFSLKSYSITPAKEIKYYLNDNGGDKTSSKTQNDFVNGRLNSQYFSLSRQPQNSNTAQERMKIKFSSPNSQKEPEKTISISDVATLGIMLNLLKTHTTNQISLSALGLLSDSDVEEITNLRNITIRISIEYLYGSGTNVYPREIIHFEIPNITFIPEDFPLGLRKNGVIVNPGFNEKLNSNTPGEKKNTFVINVKNVELDNELNPIPTNGLKINFITGQDTSVNFEIYLDKNGVVHLSNCVIDPAPTAET